MHHQCKPERRAGPADRHIELHTVDELGIPHRIDVDNYPVDRGALGRVRG